MYQTLEICRPIDVPIVEIDNYSSVARKKKKKRRLGSVTPGRLGRAFLHLDSNYSHFFVQVLTLIKRKTKRSALFIQPGALCMLAMVSPTDAWGEKCQAAPRQPRDSSGQFGCAPERCLGRVLGGRRNHTPLFGNGGSTRMPKVGAAGGVGERSVPDSFFQNGDPQAHYPGCQNRPSKEAQWFG